MDKSKKSKLRKLLAKYNPAGKPELLVADLRDKILDNLKAVEAKIKEPKDYSEYINAINNALKTLDNNLSKLTKDFYTTKAVQPDLFKKGIENFKKEIKSLLVKVEAKIPEIPEIPPDFTKDVEAIKKDLKTYRIESLSRGGGSMNRQIKVEGKDVLTKYTDINLYGVTSSVISSVDDSNKRVNIGIQGGGGGGTSAGNNTEIQFNNNGSFGASSILSFTNGTLRISESTTGITIDVDENINGKDALSLYEELTGTNIFLYNNNITLTPNSSNGGKVWVEGSLQIGQSPNTAVLSASVLTANRDYTFPDQTGTLALQSAVTQNITVGSQVLHFTNGILTSVT